MNKSSKISVKPEKPVEYYLYIAAWIIVICTALFFLFFDIVKENLYMGWTVCLLKKLTGFSCPACGGTRAMMSLLKLDLISALIYNPAAVYGILFFLWFFISQTLQRLTLGKIKGLKYKNIYWIIGICILLLNCIIKNILHIYGIDLV